jgi:AcrR family transcriptional regulator
VTPTPESASGDPAPTRADGLPERRRTPRDKGARYGRAAGADERNPQARGDLRRQQIIDAAVDLFAAKGYRGTGLAALSERVGMTATGLLYYFGSKERLLREVVAERDRADDLRPDGRFPLGFSLSSLRDLGQHNVETAILTRLYVVLGAESLEADEPLHDFFVDRYATARAFAQSILEAEKLEGKVRPDVDSAQIGLEIIATIMGFEMQWLADPPQIDFARAMNAYIDRLIVDLAPRPS